MASRSDEARERGRWRAVRACFGIGLGLALACAAAPGGREPAAPVVEGAALELAGRPLLLWQVDARGGAGGTAYVLGSIHMGPAQGLDLDPRIEEAFRGSDALVVEVDTTKLDPLDMARALLDRGALPAGETLQDRIAPETWQQLEKTLDELGVAPVTMSVFEPWVVAIHLVSLQFSAQGYDSEGGVDQYFLDEAAGQKEIVSLETLDFQLSLFDELSPELQELLLEDALAGQAAIDSESRAMLDAWQRGDAEALEAMIFSTLRERPEFAPLYQVTYFDRNRRMADALEGMLATPRTWFVVVGAGHVVGERGIVALLAERGHGVRRLSGGS
jgi:uncharacterized protein YbaP (TraB family)